MKKVIDIEERIPTLRAKRRRRSNVKFILLTTIFGVILFLLLYFQSPYSDIKTIDVTGGSIEDETFYKEQSGLNVGDSMWSFKENDIEARILKQDWVKAVTVKRKWLTTVSIQIEEWSKVAYIAKDSNFYPMLENGVILSWQDKLVPIDAPIFLEFDDEKVRKRLLKELAKLNKEVLAMISQIKATPTATDPYAITLFMNDGYEVRAEITTLASKLNHYPKIVAVIENTEGHEKGVIDIEVGEYYRSYVKEYAQVENVEDEQQGVEQNEEQSEE
ncbi:FtsQ-type POTRA domain-containing protein [Lysinibacillus louembei]|uniref:Cell division protein DivIB n=1 Tax=Lysinibacillus louembei TaxID=1470088 RepID=A0ABZ0RUX5_9BACI|nr:FtsQ-type POTRA domain-containing protein [Lysinibacillus louembei]WPK12043.1 FtsQ-type POTRA domain-containing protein [Lysinibacillus louembei]